MASIQLESALWKLNLISYSTPTSSHPTPLTGRSNSVETVSELLYTPKNERDFGTLACWAKNAIGKQTEPCLFQVVPAGELDDNLDCQQT